MRSGNTLWSNHTGRAWKSGETNTLHARWPLHAGRSDWTASRTSYTYARMTLHTLESNHTLPAGRTLCASFALNTGRSGWSPKRSRFATDAGASLDALCSRRASDALRPSCTLRTYPSQSYDTGWTA